LEQALTGHFDTHHAQLARSILRRLELVEQVLAELDQLLVEACRPWARQIELLQTIPGVGEKVAQVIIAETGGDMSRFPTAGHLASWAGLAPALHESAGRRTRSEPGTETGGCARCWSKPPAQSAGCTAGTISPPSMPD
jgi:transposase